MLDNGLDKAAENLYQLMVELCGKIEEKRKLGWLLIVGGEVETRKIIFFTSFNEKCISFVSEGGNTFYTIVVHGDCSTCGKNTLGQEYKAAYKELSTYEMMEPKTIHHVTDL